MHEGKPPCRRVIGQQQVTMTLLLVLYNTALQRRNPHGEKNTDMQMPCKRLVLRHVGVAGAMW